MEYTKLIPVTKEIFTLTETAQVEKMTPFLLRWFQEHARILPWRESPFPYYVWVSEIMLQQTRVEAVKSYFTRFIEQLPDIPSLAECEDSHLMKLWEGLGYYNRARNLKKAAQELMVHYHGELPADYEALLSLSGIGSYTAGAIASIAYGIPVPAVDGNVLRVMARVRANYEDILRQSVKKQLEELLKETMPKEHAGAFNQALMEIGAMICLPNGTPKCEECPLACVCKANMQNIAIELPVKASKKPRRREDKTVFLIRSGKKVALHKRKEEGLLAGLYELPNQEGHLDSVQAAEFLKKQGLILLDIQELDAAKHIFSHIEWHMRGYEVLCEMEYARSEYLFVDVDKIKDAYAIPTAYAAYTRYL